MSLDAIITVTPFLIICFRSLFLADLKSSRSCRIRFTSFGGKDEPDSSSSDMSEVKMGKLRQRR